MKNFKKYGQNFNSLFIIGFLNLIVSSTSWSRDDQKENENLTQPFVVTKHPISPVDNIIKTDQIKNTFHDIRLQNTNNHRSELKTMFLFNIIGYFGTNYCLYQLESPALIHVTSTLVTLWLFMFIITE